MDADRERDGSTKKEGKDVSSDEELETSGTGDQQERGTPATKQLTASDLHGRSHSPRTDWSVSCRIDSGKGSVIYPSCSLEPMSPSHQNSRLLSENGSADTENKPADIQEVSSAPESIESHINVRAHGNTYTVPSDQPAEHSQTSVTLSTLTAKNPKLDSRERSALIPNTTPEDVESIDDIINPEPVAAAMNPASRFSAPNIPQTVIDESSNKPLSDLSEKTVKECQSSIQDFKDLSRASNRSSSEPSVRQEPRYVTPRFASGEILRELLMPVKMVATQIGKGKDSYPSCSLEPMSPSHQNSRLLSENGSADTENKPADIQEVSSAPESIESHINVRAHENTYTVPSDQPAEHSQTSVTVSTLTAKNPNLDSRESSASIPNTTPEPERIDDIINLEPVAAAINPASRLSALNIPQTVIDESSDQSLSDLSEKTVKECRSSIQDFRDLSRASNRSSSEPSVRQEPRYVTPRFASGGILRELFIPVKMVPTQIGVGDAAQAPGELQQLFKRDSVSEKNTAETVEKGLCSTAACPAAGCEEDSNQLEGAFTVESLPESRPGPSGLQRLQQFRTSSNIKPLLDSFSESPVGAIVSDVYLGYSTLRSDDQSPDDKSGRDPPPSPASPPPQIGMFHSFSARPLEETPDSHSPNCSRGVVLLLLLAAILVTGTKILTYTDGWTYHMGIILLIVITFAFSIIVVNRFLIKHLFY